MSLTSVTEPQPSLAWTFESSNVDVVTGLSPSSQVSPGPAQLQGSAALVTNAPAGSNTAVYFPGTVSDYVELGTTTPTNINHTTSNLFVEVWIYFNILSGIGRIIGRGSSDTLYDWSFRPNGTQLGININGTGVADTTSLSTGKWFHVAFSYVSSTATAYTFVNGVNGGSGVIAAPAYTSTYPTRIGRLGTGAFMSGYIRDLRVVQGGVVPTASFTPSAAPFTYALPSYVTGGTTVFTLLGQFITYNPSGKYGSSIVYLNPKVGGSSNIANVATKWTSTLTSNLYSPGLTVSHWVKFFGLPQGLDRCVLWKYGDAYFNQYLSSVSSGMYDGSSYPGTSVSVTTPTIGTWYHYTSTYGNGTITTYLNGVQIGSTAGFTNAQNIPNAVLWTCTDGSLNYPSSVEFDDFRIYSSALTAAQVQSIYTQGGAPASSFRVMPQPALAWSFDGTTTDYMTGLTGTVNGSISYGNGKYGQSVIIINDVVTPSGSNSISRTFTTSFSIDNGLTVAFWFKPYQIGSSTQTLLQGGGTGGGSTIIFSMNGNATVAMWFRDSTYHTITSSAITVNTWNHLCISVGSGAVSAYLNGVSQGTTTYTPSGSVFIDFSLGAYGSQKATPSTGEFDDLRIYSSALSAAQVQEIYQEQGVPGRGFSTPYFPSPAGYDYVPFSSLPSSFTLTQTSTGNVWTINTGTNQIRDGNWGGDPALTLTPSQPSDIYSARNPGIWYRLFGNGNYVRHYIYNMYTQGYTARNFDFAWAFFLKQGTTDQVKIWNPYPGNGTGYWVQSGINTAGRIAISTTDPNQAHIYTISSPISGATKMTGAPLFSQLSASATSSAVGAFSLRAVNGVTTKAVQVQAHPVVQWPPVAMSSNATVVSAQVYGNGTYYSTELSGQSNTGSLASFNAFDNNINTYYEQLYTGSNYYDYNLGTLIDTTKTTTVSGASVAGWWIQIQLPTTIILRNYTLVGRQDNGLWNVRNPTTFWIAGSNDGTTWSNVHFQSGISYGQSGTTISVPQTSNSVAYSYYRLIVNVIGNAGAAGNHSTLNIASWNLNGDGPSYASGSATDFYADPLGNLLTAPVVGQTLANWLGGATGYVTTWYDQSGKGNHATQSTAANQPVVQRATKGPGYMLVYSGNQSLVGMSYTVLNNTNYLVNVIERRQINNSGELPVITSGNASGNGKVFILLYNNNTKVSHSHWGPEPTYSYGSAVPAYTTSSSEPLRYWTADFSQTSKEHLYLNGSSFATNSTQFPVLASTTGNFNIGYYPSSSEYYTGEIYEVLVFTQSLYDIDGTSSINQIYQNQFAYTGT